MLDLKSLVDLADKLGIIQAVKSKLLRQPDAAADSEPPRVFRRLFGLSHAAMAGWSSVA